MTQSNRQNWVNYCFKLRYINNHYSGSNYESTPKIGEEMKLKFNKFLWNPELRFQCPKKLILQNKIAVLF